MTRSTKPRKAMTTPAVASTALRTREVVVVPEPEVRRRARQHGDERRDAREPAQLRRERNRLFARAKGSRYFGDCHRLVSVEVKSVLSIPASELLRFLSGRPGPGCPVPPPPVCRDRGPLTPRRRGVFASDDGSDRRLGLGRRRGRLGGGRRPRRRGAPACRSTSGVVFSGSAVSVSRRSRSRGWLADRAKGEAIGIALAAGGLGGGRRPRARLAVVVAGCPRRRALALAVLALTFVAPVVLEPLFNRFRPLEDERLAGALRALADRAGRSRPGRPRRRREPPDDADERVRLRARADAARRRLGHAPRERLRAGADARRRARARPPPRPARRQGDARRDGRRRRRRARAVGRARHAAAGRLPARRARARRPRARRHAVPRLDRRGGGSAPPTAARSS